MKIEKIEKMNYTPLEIEIVEVKIEQGYATSDDDGMYSNMEGASDEDRETW